MASKRNTCTCGQQLTLFKFPSVSKVHPPRIQKYRKFDSSKKIRDVWNSRLLAGLLLARPYDIPVINSCDDVPEYLEVFSEIRRGRLPKPGTWVHFYEDDIKFLCFWKRPEKYLSYLRQYTGVISPDFSLYENFPTSEKIFAVYRNQLLGAWLEKQGIKVIPNVRLSGIESIPYALAGVPERKTLAISTHGCISNRKNRERVMREIRYICDIKKPTNLLIYGSSNSNIVSLPQEYGVQVHVYSPDTWNRATCRKDAP